jgi:dUTP pyrophosphatase
MEIKVKYLEDILPIEVKDGSDWIDLRCAVKTELIAGQYKQIPLGVAIQLPAGYEAHVVPRSSTFKKYGVLLANGVGIIDGSYCGDNDLWHFLAYPTRDAVIEKNERICQFRIIKNQPEIDLKTVDVLGNPDRCGIGSTGRV